MSEGKIIINSKDKGRECNLENNNFQVKFCAQDKIKRKVKNDVKRRYNKRYCNG